MSGPGPASAQLPRPGDMIAGKYVLDRLLGQGGMGAVFAARHVKLSKNVAIKIMLADTSNPEAAQRFINEGRAAANIQNEHVVRVDDVDEEMGYAYMVLELLEGEDLSQILDKEPTRRVAPHVAVDFVLQALKGVSQAHAIGIVHRDLKPSNLFLAKRKDGSTVVKVLDFGISKAQGSSALAASPSGLTSTKAMLGSPLYMSPEQLRSSKSVDQRADIWAMGIILYELVTGALPFMGETLGELFAAILETDPSPPSARVQGVPPGLDEIVLRCLQRRPENRFQSAAELAAALSSFTTAQPAYRASSPTNPLAGTAVLPPNAPSSANVARLGAVTPPVQSGFAMTPTGQSGFGSTPNPIIGGTTGGWQSTGGAAAGVPASKPPFVALAIGAVAMVGLVTGLALFVPKMLSKSGTEASATSAASAPPPPVSAPPTAASATPVVPPTAPVETAAASASASAAVATPATNTHSTTSPTKKGATTSVKADPPKTEPAKPVDPPKPVSKPPTKPAPPSVEENR